MAVEKIQYQAGNVTGHGALVWNEKVSGKRPLMLVMTNWLGVTDILINRAAKMAGDKYVAFVADMYGNGRTSAGPPESQDLMMAVRADRVEGRKTVLAGARIGQRLTRHRGQPERVIEFAVRQQSRIGRDHGAAKLQHQAAVEIESNDVRFRFTRRLCHDRLVRSRIRY